jgi:DNA-binding transcriptional regulator PaaX
MHFDALMPAQVLPSTWIGQTPDEMNAAWKKAVGLK